MNSLIQYKTTIPPLLIAGVLACFELLPKVEAVNPPPDGGYPGGNTAEGQDALQSIISGGYNSAVGFFSLFANTTGSFNTAVGAGALDLNSGDNNTATGAAALLLNTTGISNTATGVDALVYNDTGTGNTANGIGALYSNTTGNLNTANGFFAGFNVSTADNVICIGSFVDGANVSNSCFIGNIRGVTTANPDAVPVLIDSAGQLGTISSSRRFKNEIKPMDKASEAILSLKPVTFNYKSDAKNTPQFGLIAEEVAKVNPDLVVRDKDGEIYTVRYDAVNAMLLNEFLKEHRTVQEQQKEIDVLKAELKQQRALIQKVSAQIELSKASPRTALNDQ